MRIYLLKKRKKRVQRGTEKKVHPLICERENGWERICRLWGWTT